MKNILVLTDFSENAKAAEKYALQLAIHTEGSLILYNSYSRQREAVSGNVVWPHSTPSSELQSISELQSRVNALNNEVRKDKTGSHRPEIRHLGNAGPLTDNLEKTITENDIWLTVMGTKGENFASNVVFGSNVFKVLEKINRPLLIVPKEAEFNNLQKIAYATDFRSSDAGIVKWLYELKQLLQVELLLVHVSTDMATEKEKDILVTQETSYKSEFPEASIQLYEGENIQDSLHKIDEELNVDMIALLHRRHEFFESLFHPSISHKMIKHTESPVLIFRDL